MSCCPICGKNKVVKSATYAKKATDVFIQWEFYGIALTFKVCKNCGILYCTNLEELKKHKK